LSIKFLANKLELNIFVFKINSFRKNITFRIVAINDIDCAIIFLKRILLIVFDRFVNFLFNIDEDIFNRKRIIDVLY